MIVEELLFVMIKVAKIVVQIVLLLKTKSNLNGGTSRIFRINKLLERGANKVKVQFPYGPFI